MPWRYQTQSRLRAQPIWGGVAFYRGGGYVVDLGPNKQHARRYGYLILMCRVELVVYVCPSKYVNINITINKLKQIISLLM